MRGGWRTAGARRARFLPRRPHAILPPPPPVVYQNVRFVFDGQRIQETTTPDDVRRGGGGRGGWRSERCRARRRAPAHHPSPTPQLELESGDQIDAMVEQLGGAAAA